MHIFTTSSLLKSLVVSYSFITCSTETVFQSHLQIFSFNPRPTWTVFFLILKWENISRRAGRILIGSLSQFMHKSQQLENTKEHIILKILEVVLKHALLFHVLLALSSLKWVNDKTVHLETNQLPCFLQEQKNSLPINKAFWSCKECDE